MARERSQDQIKYHLEAWRTFTVTEVLFCDEHFHTLFALILTVALKGLSSHFTDEDGEAQRGYKSKVTQLGMVGVF